MAVGEIVVLGRHSPSRGAMGHILNVVVDGLIMSGWFAETTSDFFVREAFWILSGGDLARAMVVDGTHGCAMCVCWNALGTSRGVDRERG